MAVSTDIITGALSFLFTLLIFSYLLGDNPLFRIATYIFVGVASGYVVVVAMWQVIYPRLLYPLVHGSPLDRALLAVPFLLSGLMLMKVTPRFSQVGSPSMAYLVGVSAAVTVGGAVIGTLFPQAFAAINAFSLPMNFETLFDGVLILIGAATTLVYFQFSARTVSGGAVHRFGLVEVLAWVGRIFIAITLGVLFAGVFLAALAALIERFASWADFFALLIH